MIKLLKTYKLFIVYLSVVITVFLLSRLVNLLNLPIFTDEAIYAYWSQVALNDPQHRYISLTDGKQPSFIWLGAIYQLIFQDPLVAIRIVSVTAGFFSTVGIFLLGKEIFNRTIGVISAALYVSLPFTLIYDRLGIYDSFLTSVGIWSTLFLIKLAKTPKLDIALITGLLLGLGQITKSSANFFLYLAPFSLIFLELNKQNKFKLISKWLLLLSLSAIISTVIYNSLRLSPYFYIIGQKNMEFLRPISDVVTDPLSFALSNSQTLLLWLVNYSGLVLSLVFVLTILVALFHRDKKIFYLTTLFIVPFVAISVVNKIIYPRFLLFFYPYFILISAYGIFSILTKVKQNWQKAVLLFVILLQPVVISFFIVINPLKADIPKSDALQLRDDWPSGYGVKEIVSYLKEESKNQKITVGTEGTFGLYPYALNIYFYNNKNVEVLSFWPVDTNVVPEEILNKSQVTKTYFIFNESQEEIINQDLKLIASYKKGNGNSYMRLYEVVSNTQ